MKSALMFLVRDLSDAQENAALIVQNVYMKDKSMKIMPQSTAVTHAKLVYAGIAVWSVPSLIVRLQIVVNHL